MQLAPQDQTALQDQTRAPEEPTRRPELGLALSGGGFRASFFHVGVLARLAETGMLRKVEVISTVSGGSILGALYYLALKDLLENVPDAEITDEHYLQVVSRVEQALFKGVGRQVRALAYADLGKNLKMRHPNYSRSDRIGELYDEIFYRPMWSESKFGGAPAPRSDDEPIEMRELLIHPPGEPDTFKPLRENGRRSAPVPVLLLNATSLNTGHNWRFQAVEMGEPARDSSEWVQIDKNVRLLSGRYGEIVESQQDFPLGHAVAASACVPALFHPLAISGLFPSLSGDGGSAAPTAKKKQPPVRVELVDGGVHDNQGVDGLFDLRCGQIVVSDASGQMGDFADPSTRIPAAAGRSSSIYGDRVREEQLVSALTRLPKTVLVHLRKGVPVLGVPPFGPDGNGEPASTLGESISYPVALEVQRMLSSVRTDLDSFSQLEAYSLSLYAYLMTRHELPDSRLTYEWGLDAGDVKALLSELGDPKPAFKKQLGVAGKRFRKASALNGAMRALELVAALLALVVAGVLAWLVFEAVPEDVPTWSLVIAVVLPAALVGLYLKQKFPSKILYRLADGLYTWLLPAIAAPFLWVASKVTLWASKKFLAEGLIAKVAAKDGKAG